MSKTVSIKNPLLAFAGVTAVTLKDWHGPQAAENSFRAKVAIQPSNEPVADSPENWQEDGDDEAGLYERIELIRKETLGDLAGGIINNSVDDLDARAIFNGLVFPLLAKLADKRGDATGHAALRVAIGSMRILLDPAKYDVEIVRRLDAIAQGFDDVDSNAGAIVELAEMVERSVGFRRMNDPRKHGIPFDNPTTTVSTEAPGMLHRWLTNRYGADRIPTVTEIADMLDKHANTRVRGRLTTIGIVARIIDRGGLLGANVGGEKAMLKRVDNALKRHRK